jgi:polar amino acid transport system permease protein
MSLIYEARWVLLRGALTTIELTLASGALATVLAFLAGLARLSANPLVAFVALVYVEVFRGVALLVQLFWLFFVLPFFGVYLSPFITAVIAIGLCNGAYGAEIVRSAILAVPNGQREAAQALNYTPTQALQRVLVRQALPAMLPPFCNLAIELLKATALVSLITVHDLSFQAMSLRETTMQSLEPFTAVLVGYFLIALLVTAGFRRLEIFANRGLMRGTR